MDASTLTPRPQTSHERPERFRPTSGEERVIVPRTPGMFERLREFWAYRRLLPYFGRRTLEVRYLRTWIGWPWIPLRPVLDVGSRALLFGGLLGVPSEGVPYPLFLLVGLAAWQLFDRTAFWAMRSLQLNKGLLGQVYVPRLTVVSGALTPSLAEYLVYAAITAAVTVAYWIGDGTFHIVLGVTTLLAVAGLLLCVALAFVIGMVLAVYAAQARDVRFLFPYVMGFWLFLTPILYPLSAVPEHFQVLVQFNPMTTPIEMVKMGLLGIGELTVTGAVSTALALVAGGVASLAFFNAAETRVLDSL